MMLTSSGSASTTTKTLMAISAVTWVSVRMTMGFAERTSTCTDVRSFMIQHHANLQGCLNRRVGIQLVVINLCYYSSCLVIISIPTA